LLSPSQDISFKLMVVEILPRAHLNSSAKVGYD
jgi:hypothetical protein